MADQPETTQPNPIKALPGKVMGLASGKKSMLIKNAATGGIALILIVMAIGTAAGLLRIGPDWGKPTAFAAMNAGVECELRWPSGASTDDKLVGKALDAYVNNVLDKSNSPIMQEFKTKNKSLGEIVSIAARAANMNPTLTIAIAQHETQFATDDNAVSSKPAPKGKYNPFGRKKDEDTYMTFSSYEDAFAKHPPYLRRKMVKEGNAKNIMDVMNIYAPASDGNDTTGYVADLRKRNNDMIALAKQSFQGALGTGQCTESGAGGAAITIDQGLCDQSFCIQKPFALTAEMDQTYGTPKAIILHDFESTSSVQDVYNYFAQLDSNGNPDDNKYVQFIISRKGEVFQLLGEKKKVAGAEGYNTVPGDAGSITISIENEGYFSSNKSGLQETDAQVAANVSLVKYLMSKYSIAKSNVISHTQADERRGVTGRKSDPGTRFMNKVMPQI